MKAPLVFDVDGVLADFRTGYARACRDLGIEAPGPAALWDDYLDYRVWQGIKASADFWLSLSALVSYGTFRRIGAMTDDRDVYFATNRHGRHVKWQTTRWLEAMSITRPTVVITTKKGEFARVVGAEFLLDDKAGNAMATVWLSPETRSFLIDRPWNRGFDPDCVGRKVQRVDTVEEFLDIVEAA